MLQNIPKNRLFLYFLLAGLVPILAVVIIVFSQISDLNTLENSIVELQIASQIREKKQATNMAVRNHYKDADHFYIDKYLETLTFLEPEVESIQKALNNPYVAEDEQLKKRLEYLTTSANSMSFSEGVVQSTPLFQETTETLVHPVEINLQDLQKILARIEGIEISSHAPSPNRPQLIVLDFKLDRKNEGEKIELFQLNLKLLKREFL